jgi:hypothetical protein
MLSAVALTLLALIDNTYKARASLGGLGVGSVTDCIPAAFGCGPSSPRLSDFEY